MDAKLLEADKLSVDSGEPEEHTYEEGYWKKVEKHRYEVKHDTCIKCGCQRHWVRSNHTDNKPLISGFTRSKNYFGHEHEPACWGSLNP